MSIRETLYRWTLRGLRGASPFVSGGDSKLARGVRGRRGAADALVRWGREERDPERPLAWFHAPSVGEGFQARAVSEALRSLRPRLQVIHTYFSPSAESFVRDTPADFRGYLPWDVPDEVEPVLDAVRPDLLAFTKTEVWPVLTQAAAGQRGLPVVLVAGTLSPEAGRLTGPGRWLLSPAFGRLARVAAIAEGDGRRFGRLGVPPDRVVVTGDPGVDSAVQRLEASDPDAAHLTPFRASGRRWLVAGSTWKPDEDVLVPALSRLRAAHPDLGVIVAPHEPGDEHVSDLLGALASGGWRAERLGPVEERGSVAQPGGAADAGRATDPGRAGRGPHGAVPSGTDAVVVDRVGVLASLYSVGFAAYVGGGFHPHGLHSVLEPAAAGVPVLFGPKHRNARAAGELLTAGGAEEVGTASALEAALGEWLDAPERAEGAGAAARAWIDRHRGASRRTAGLLDALLPDVTPSPASP